MKKSIEAILKYAVLMHERNLVNTYDGNLSAIENDIIYITPSKMSKRDLCEEHICQMDAGSDRQIGGLCKASSEYLLHSNIYRMRSDVAAVVHCHSAYLTAFAIAGQPVQTKAYAEMIQVFGKIPVVPYGRPGTQDIYKHMPEYIKDYDVVLLANHGVVAVGSSVMDAFNKLETAEACARVLTLAKLHGAAHDLPETECAALFRSHT